LSTSWQLRAHRLTIFIRFCEETRIRAPPNSGDGLDSSPSVLGFCYVCRLRQHGCLSYEYEYRQRRHATDIQFPKSSLLPLADKHAGRASCPPVAFEMRAWRERSATHSHTHTHATCASGQGWLRWHQTNVSYGVHGILVRDARKGLAGPRVRVLQKRRSLLSVILYSRTSREVRPVSAKLSLGVLRLPCYVASKHLRRSFHSVEAISNESSQYLSFH
jgi:hypothetical protein